MTTTTLRPNATISTADTLTGGASAHAVTSDDSDSSFWVDNDIVQVGFGTLTLSPDVTKQIRFRARAEVPDGNPAGTVYVYLLKSASAQIVKTPLSLTTALATFTDAYIPVTLTQTEINGLRIKVEGDAGFVHSFYELYIDLVTVDQPVVAVDAVTDPVTTTTIVPVSWVNTLDADGGGQTRYQVRAFTDAQYGAGGFDPDTSDAYYDSGVVVSSATSANVGPLETGDTYRAYVRVAQTVNGALHWSDWDYDEFTVTVDTADVDTVAAVATDVSGLITVTVERDTGSESWEFVEVQRSIDAGATWVDVRGATYVDATGDADTFVIVDYEAPNGVDVDYRARATRILSTLPITGSWVETSASESWSSTDCWLKAPNAPTLNVTFKLGGRDPVRRARRTGVFSVVGLDAPVTVSDVRSKRSGTLRVVTETSGEAEDLDELLVGSAVLLVQFPASMDIAGAYVAVIDDEDVFRMASADLVSRMWSLRFVEVVSPSDPDAGR